MKNKKATNDRIEKKINAVFAHRRRIMESFCAPKRVPKQTHFAFERKQK